MRITRVYTRSGDAGETALANGDRLPKDDMRVEAYGAVDELNASLAVARSFLCVAGAPVAEADDALERIQSELFQLGAELSSPDPAALALPRLGPEHIAQLEEEIDRFNGDLPPLEEFLLPGGGKTGSHLHQARVVCRRAERRVVTLVQADAAEPTTMQYLNRLSDLLFVLARWCAKATGALEVLWDRGP